MIQSELLQQLKIKYPIIQAPMAGGITTKELVAEVTKEGALGMIGAGYMNASALQEQIKAVKKQTDHPFGVNLFVPNDFIAEQHAVQHAKDNMAKYYEQLSVDDANIPLPSSLKTREHFAAQIDVLLEEKIPVCSFTFGIPAKETIRRLQDNGTIVIGTATTPNEARLIEESGMDMIVAQGMEAGGHRGTFHGEYEEALIGLFALLPHIAEQTKLPVIASGGIMDGKGLAAAVCLGAQAVQMGTAFLLTQESGAHQLHRQAILQQQADQTTLTKAFSGKLARGIKNEFIEEMKEIDVPVFPVQNALTKDIRAAAKENKAPGLMSLWAGQAGRLGQELPVKSLIDNTMKEAASLLNKQTGKGVVK